MVHFTCITCGKDGDFGADYTTIKCTPWRKASSPCPPCVKLGSLDRQIVEARAFLSHLEAHRATFDSSINEFHDPFTSLLPTELASRIFNLCKSDKEDIDSSREPWPRHRVPFTLSAVSRRWQAVAKSNPSLWNDVHLRLEPGRAAGLDENALFKWLSRSAQHPLTIQLRIPYCHPHDYMWWEFCKSMIDILGRCSTRWADLSIKIPYDILSLIQGRDDGAPLLHHLSIEGAFPGEVGNPSSTGAFSLQATLPSPRSVSLTVCELRLVHINWSKVTQAQVFGLPLSDCLMILRSAPELRNCTMHDIDEAGALQAHNNPIFLANLTTFDLRITTDQISLFLDVVTTPSLTTLRYECFGVFWYHLSNFLRRGSCPLTSLTIIDSDCVFDLPDHDHELFGVLYAIPTLEILKLYQVDISDDFFKLLGGDNPNDEDDADVFIPSLTHLFIEYTREPLNFSWPAVHRAIAARVSRGPRVGGQGVFTNLEILIQPDEEDDDRYYIDKESLDAFQHLIDAGVEIQLYNQVSADDVMEYSREYHSI
ncbi:unnamed protein product [Cyclocybe aegerita]|uniref:F-box domain-containing protein n=1 Tax=Cyclocybe aegerita TaxID=1973307 RepID=A0A8S0W0B7_CYCAE|nr:unnamed protein product [Cyclocybe aegerita]